MKKNENKNQIKAVKQNSTEFYSSNRYIIEKSKSTINEELEFKELNENEFSLLKLDIDISPDKINFENEIFENFSNCNSNDNYKDIRNDLFLLEDENEKITNFDELNCLDTRIINGYDSNTSSKKSFTKIKSHVSRELISKKKNNITKNCSISHDNISNSNNVNVGYWSLEEHQLFIDCIYQYGNDWKKIITNFKTRNMIQLKSHAQKIFKKLVKLDLFNIENIAEKIYLFNNINLSDERCKELYLNCVKTYENKSKLHNNKYEEESNKSDENDYLANLTYRDIFYFISFLHKVVKEIYDDNDKDSHENLNEYLFLNEFLIDLNGQKIKHNKKVKIDSMYLKMNKSNNEIKTFITKVINKIINILHLHICDINILNDTKYLIKNCDDIKYDDKIENEEFKKNLILFKCLEIINIIQQMQMLGKGILPNKIIAIKNFLSQLTYLSVNNKFNDSSKKHCCSLNCLSSLQNSNNFSSASEKFLTRKKSNKSGDETTITDLKDDYCKKVFFNVSSKSK